MNHLDHYLPHVGSPFEIRYPDGFVITLSLQEARDVGSTADQEQFALFFQGPAEYPLAQATYGLIHEALGEQVLFLVPVERNADGFRYQAVFNRLIDR
jgi:hypothetical protein